MQHDDDGVAATRHDATAMVDASSSAAPAAAIAVPPGGSFTMQHALMWIWPADRKSVG